MAANRLQSIEALLRAKLNPLHLELTDNSDLHAGHAGAGKGGHFTLFIVSEQFIGIKLIKRHRLVYAALADLMPDEIHALSIKSLSPEEFTKKQEM